jgi:hypothetical protein
MRRTSAGLVHLLLIVTAAGGCSAPADTVFLDGGNGRDGSADGALPNVDFGTTDATVHLDAPDSDQGVDAGGLDVGADAASLDLGADPDLGTDAGGPDAGTSPCSPPTGAAAPPFPDDVVAWYDSCDPAVILDTNDRVVSWPARAGSAPALEPYGTGALAVTSSALGGRVMAFDTGLLRTTTSTWNTVQNTIIVLVVPVATSGEDIVGSGNYWTPNDTLLMLYTGQVAGHFWPMDRFTGTQTYGTIPVATNLPVVLSQVNDGVVRTLSVFTNGVENGTNSWAQAANSTPLRPILVGRRCEVCPASENFTGEIAEVLIYDRPLTVTERVEAEDFVRSRFGLPSP